YLLNQKDIDPLLLICNFVLNFICIFPFESGNGRMVRLLISLLLLQSKHSLVKYIS
ncbi:Fic family protein, partial [Bacillus thuringiensis]